MARRPRLSVAGWPHLVLLDAAPGQRPFHDDDDRAAFVDALRLAARPPGAAPAVEPRVRLHGWALTERRALLLVVPADGEALGAAVQALGRRFVAAHRRRHGGAGGLWAGRFRAAAIEPGPVALDAMLLVDASARDGAADARDALAQRWSSARHHAGVERSPWLDDAPEWWALGNTPFEREAVYLERLRQGPPAGAARLLDAARRGLAVTRDGLHLTPDAPARPLDDLARRGRPPRGAAPRRAAVRD